MSRILIVMDNHNLYILNESKELIANINNYERRYFKRGDLKDTGNTVRDLYVMPEMLSALKELRANDYICSESLKERINKITT